MSGPSSLWTRRRLLGTNKCLLVSEMQDDSFPIWLLFLLNWSGIPNLSGETANEIRYSLIGQDIHITTFRSLLGGIPFGKWPRSFAATATPCASRTFRKRRRAEGVCCFEALLVPPEISFILPTSNGESKFPGAPILRIRGSAVGYPSHLRLVTRFLDVNPGFLPNWSRTLFWYQRRYVIVPNPRNGDSE